MYDVENLSKLKNIGAGAPEAMKAFLAFDKTALAAGAIPAIPLNLILLKGITVRGMEIRTFAADHPDEAARDMQELEQMFADGRIRPYIGARFPLAETATALRHVADRKAIGKVVIDVD